MNLIAIPKGFCAIFPEEFITNFKSCTPYYYDEGAKIRQVIGWGNSRCNYREIVSKGVVDCKFRQSEVDEIAYAMRHDYRKANPLRVVYEDGEVQIFNTGWLSLDIWKKYLNKKGTCSSDFQEFNIYQQ